MSRSGYSDDIEDNWQMIKWRGRVASAIRGQRGQALLREIAAAMDAMPDKRLTTAELEADGDFCTLGVVGAARGLDLSKIDTFDHDQLGETFDVAACMAQEIMWENDECVIGHRWVDVVICGPMRLWERHKRNVTVDDPSAPSRRWAYMREWVQKHIKALPA